MSKILIIYDPRTGNTEKMASAVAEGARQVKGVKVNVKKIDKAMLEDLQAADGIIMGAPTYYGGMSGKLKEFIDKSVKIHGKLEGKVGARAVVSAGWSLAAFSARISAPKHVSDLRFLGLELLGQFYRLSARVAWFPPCFHQFVYG